MDLKYLVLACIMFVFAGPVVSDNPYQGQRFIQNFAPLEYNAHPQNWSVVQNSRGLIYIANNYGVLEFDGRNFTIFPSEPGVAIRSLALDSNDRLYYGGSNSFGYMVPAANGMLEYYPLNNALPEDERNIGVIMDTHVIGDKVFFRGNDKIFVFQHDSVSWLATDGPFHRTYNLDGTFYAHKRDAGLLHNVNNELLPVANGDIFADKLIYLFLPWDNDLVLVGTNDNKLYLFNSAADVLDALIPFENEAADFLLENQIYKGIWVADSMLAIGTMRGGAVIISKNGQVVERINKTNGLQDESVWDIYADKNQKIWLALNNGISMKELNHPMMFWDENSGLEGVVQDLVSFESKIYVATMHGLYVLEKNGFKGFSNAREIAWTFAVRNHRGTEELYAGTRSGVFQLVGDSFEKIINNKTVLKIYFTDRYPDVMFVGTIQGVLVLKNEAGRWRNLGMMQGVEGQIRNFYIDKHDNLWLQNYLVGVQRLTLDPDNLLQPTIQLFAAKNNPIFAGINFFPVNDTLLFVSNEGLFVYDYEHQEFVKHNIFGEDFSVPKIILSPIQQMSNGDVWLYRHNHYSYSRTLHIFSQSDTGQWVEKAPPCNCFPQLPVYDIMETETDIWIGAASGIFKFEKDFEKGNEFVPDIFIKRLIAGNDSIYLYGVENLSVGANSPVLPFAKNYIEFEFACPSFSQVRSGISFSYWLEGYEEDWSDWTQLYRKSYTNLPPGKYTFHFKASYSNGLEIQGDALAFSVKRPWFLSWYGFTAYFLIVVALIILGNRYYVNNLRRKNDALQHIISLRTLEIRRQSEEIGKKNDVLEQQKEEILAQSQQLEEINKSLENRIIDELSKSRKKDIMLVQQSRQAAMGEMIGNIAHQWRQPLNAVAVIVQNIQEAYKHDDLSVEYIDEKVGKSMEIIQYMSQTIDDFRNFFKPEKNMQEFGVMGVVEKCISLVEATLRRNNIQLSFHASEEINVQGYPNEYAQVVLNLLNNSKDILLERKISNPIIEVTLFQKEGQSYLYVQDNGGGVSDQVTDKIFTPYFSTKQPGEGTGLGLYMSKTIIEKNMGGSLTFENTRDGVEFIIRL